MCFPHSVKGKLIFYAAVIVKLPTDLIVKVERIAENSPADIVFLQLFGKPLEISM